MDKRRYKKEMRKLMLQEQKYKNRILIYESDILYKKARGIKI